MNIGRNYQMVYQAWLLTLQARFSTNEIMEFLKRVAAVSGRLVTSVMLSLPSGHIPFSTGLQLDGEKKNMNTGLY